MRKVREGLYIGSVDDARLFLSGDRKGVTHVLSLEKVRARWNPDRKKKKAPQLSKLQQALLESQRPDPVFDSIAAELAEKCPSAGQPIVKTVLLKDVVKEDLLGRLDSCLEFINQGRQRGIVLVHCGAGVSRSAAVVTAYLMRKEKLELVGALDSLRKCSPQVSPNQGFMQQLKQFERKEELQPCEEPERKRVKVC